MFKHFVDVAISLLKLKPRKRFDLHLPKTSAVRQLGDALWSAGYSGIEGCLSIPAEVHAPRGMMWKYAGDNVFISMEKPGHANEGRVLVWSDQASQVKILSYKEAFGRYPAKAAAPQVANSAPLSVGRTDEWLLERRAKGYDI